MTSVTSTAVMTGQNRTARAGWLPYAAWPLPTDHSAAPRARSAMRRALTSLGVTGECLQDALVCVSELATNAVAHAPGPHELRLLVRGGAIVCEITDADWRPVRFPPLTPPEPDNSRGDAVSGALGQIEVAEHGRGLALVTLLSAGQCGSRPVPGGKGVWFVLPLAMRPGN